MSDPASGCVVCRRRWPERGRVCDADRAWLRGMLRDVPDLHAQLLTLGYVQRDGDEVKRWPDGRRRPHHDPVAHHLVAGPVPGGSGQPHVSGSHDPDVPGWIDLTGGAYRQRDGVHDEHGDQAGDASIAAVLDSWAREWITYGWCPGEHLPPPRVAHLARWLLVRLDPACDHHPAIDNFAEELRAARVRLLGALGDLDLPDWKIGVPCKGCDLRALYQRSGCDLVECAECPRVLTAAEFRQWAALVAAHLDPADLDEEQRQRWARYTGGGDRAA